MKGQTVLMMIKEGEKNIAPPCPHIVTLSQSSQ